ncbi:MULTISPECIES: helix-turn-helix domain-containing protein [Afifella]|uniref:helix-turn-helix domain-containing protein n=1 Tax=Afifella TaxID=643217 RepID=UPI000FE3C9C6|nr:DNA-binding transcriptional regulator [Afifella aestuarii]
MKSADDTYRSDAFAAVHETASDLHEAGLMDKETLRGFDMLCLTPVKALSPDEIKALRERERVSQAVFARYLNVTAGLVSQWERGEKKPAGPSLKLLSLVRNRGLRAIA